MNVPGTQIARLTTLAAALLVLAPRTGGADEAPDTDRRDARGVPHMEVRLTTEEDLSDPAGAIVLSLAQAIEMALRQNLDLDTAQLAARQAAASVMGARGAFDPVFNFFYNHAKEIDPQASELNAPISVNASDVFDASFTHRLPHGATYEARITAVRNETNNPFFSFSPNYSSDALLKYTQPLLRGLGRDANRRAIAEALNDVAVADNQFAITARDVVQDTIDAYWELVFSREDLAVRRASLRLAQDLERKNRIMVDVGTLAPLEVTQSEAAVANRRHDIIVAEASVGSAEDTLRRLIGVEESSDWWRHPIVPADEPEFRDTWVDLTESLDIAFRNREELESARLRVDSAELTLAEAKDALLPRLDLEASLSTSGLGGDRIADLDGDTVPETFIDEDFGDPFRQLRRREFNSWSAGLNLSVPVFNRVARAGYQIARLELEDQLVDREKARQAVILDVRAAVRDVKAARERIDAARSSRHLQQVKLEAEIRKFENDLSTNFEILTFQTDLTTAESAEIRALVDYLKALAALDEARGTLLDDDDLALAWQ